MDTPDYKRVVLKLSGEALAGNDGFGINPSVVNLISAQIKEVVELGVEVAIVVGGGNIWRGKLGSEMGMDRAPARPNGYACDYHEFLIFTRFP